MAAKKPRPRAGGVVRFRSLLVDQRAQPPDTPPRGVVVVVAVIRTRSYMPPEYREAGLFRQGSKDRVATTSSTERSARLSRRSTTTSRPRGAVSDGSEAAE